MTAKQHWNDLNPKVRRNLLIAAGVEGALKAAALVDLARRPQHEVRGSKGRWAAALVLVNSGGVLPLFYFARARR
jgi:hypothetical protein